MSQHPSIQRIPQTSSLKHSASNLPTSLHHSFWFPPSSSSPLPLVVTSHRGVFFSHLPPILWVLLLISSVHFPHMETWLPGYYWEMHLTWTGIVSFPSCPYCVARQGGLCVFCSHESSFINALVACCSSLITCYSICVT